MIRFKKNKSLKELEKFGFIEYNGFYYKTYMPKEHHYHLDYVEVIVWKDRRIYLNFCYESEKKKSFFRKQVYDYGLNIIFDLIEAGLVEKVGDEYE